jgi:hypothetical protein
MFGKIILFSMLFQTLVVSANMFDCASFDRDECVDVKNRPKYQCGQESFCTALQACTWCSTTNATSSCIPSPDCSDPNPQATLSQACPAGFVENHNPLDCAKRSQIRDVFLSLLSLLPSIVFAVVMFRDWIPRIGVFCGLYAIFLTLLLASKDLLAWGIVFAVIMAIPGLYYLYQKCMKQPVENEQLHVHLLDV